MVGKDCLQITGRTGQNLQNRPVIQKYPLRAGADCPEEERLIKWRTTWCLRLIRFEISETSNFSETFY